MIRIPLSQHWKPRLSRGSVIYSSYSIPFSEVTIRIPWIAQASRRSMATVIHSPRDPNTLSNYNNWISTHITANFDILFEEKKLVGNVVHKLRSITDARSTEIILDTNHVEIGDVRVDGQASHWELLPTLEPYGAALKVKLDQGVGLNQMVEVDVNCPPACVSSSM